MESLQERHMRLSRRLSEIKKDTEESLRIKRALAKIERKQSRIKRKEQTTLVQKTVQTEKREKKKKWTR